MTAKRCTACGKTRDQHQLAVVRVRCPAGETWGLYDGDTPARPDAGTTLEPLSWTDARKLVLDSIHRATGYEAEQREADTLGAYITDLSKQAAERERLEAQVEEMAEQLYDSISKSEARDMVERLEAEREVLATEATRLAVRTGHLEAEVARMRAALGRCRDKPSAVDDIVRRALTSAGEEPDTATDYYHTEMQRLSGEGEPSDG
jgi:hypothetical protein